uniref:Macaca fascicularis brain cDNA, clone: QflA-22386 n=1 Tax=Macaca fascicularis TaxID=9541 RepID=I7GIT1_MACFA|nr:unnamed protein product [Macaca fascicularis]
MHVSTKVSSLLCHPFGFHYAFIIFLSLQVLWGFFCLFLFKLEKLAILREGGF